MKAITRRKPVPMTFPLCSRLLATGQRLRADETAVANTFALHFAARRVAAQKAVR